MTPHQPPRFGTAVEGDSRFTRPDLEAQFDHVLAHTNGVRLFGLRRTGKSTEARALCARLHKLEPGAHIIEVDAQGMSSEGALVADMLKKVPESAKGLRDRFIQAVGSDEGIPMAVRGALQKFAGAPAELQAYFVPIMGALERALAQQTQAILVIDELPWLCKSILESDATDGRRRVDMLLASLRRLRDRQVRMVLLGSIGMVALLRQHGLNVEHLNDLKLFEIPPLPPEEARAFLTWLVERSQIKGWTDDHTQACLDECDALYPAVLHLAFIELTVGGRAASLGKFEDIFADRVRPDFDAAIYAQFDRRLLQYRKLPAPLPRLLLALLGQAMSLDNASGTLPELRQALQEGDDESDLRDALTMLREDGFLTVRVPRKQPERWSAASPLVTAWWAQSHGARG
jgi:hypothetical protein